MVTFVTPKSSTLPSDSILTQSPRVAIHGPTVQTKGLMSLSGANETSNVGCDFFLSHYQTLAPLEQG